MNSNSLVITQKQKQTYNKTIYIYIYIYMTIEFQNPIARLSFLCRVKDIKIAWINPCINRLFRPVQQTNN